MNKKYIGIGIAIIMIIAIIAVASQSNKRDTLNILEPHKSSRERATTTDAEISGERVRGPEEITLGIGETDEAAGLEITFNKFIQDNRCPSDTDCSEAGAVTVNITLTSGDDTETRNQASDEAPYEFAGYAVSIVDIGPELSSDTSIPENDYEITFRVEPTAQGDNI